MLGYAHDLSAKDENGAGCPLFGAADVLPVLRVPNKGQANPQGILDGCLGGGNLRY